MLTPHHLPATTWSPPFLSGYIPQECVLYLLTYNLLPTLQSLKTWLPLHYSNQTVLPKSTVTLISLYPIRHLLDLTSDHRQPLLLLSTLLLETPLSWLPGGTAPSFPPTSLSVSALFSYIRPQSTWVPENSFLGLHDFLLDIVPKQTHSYHGVVTFTQKMMIL